MQGKGVLFPANCLDCSDLFRRKDGIDLNVFKDLCGGRCADDDARHFGVFEYPGERKGGESLVSALCKVV